MLEQKEEGLLGLGAGQGWRYQSTNGLDSPALYVSITTPTLCFPFSFFLIQKESFEETNYNFRASEKVVSEGN